MERPLALPQPSLALLLLCVLMPSDERQDSLSHLAAKVVSRVSPKGVWLGGLPFKCCVLLAEADCAVSPLLMLPLAKVPQLPGVGLLEGKLLNSELAARIRLPILFPLYLWR